MRVIRTSLSLLFSILIFSGSLSAQFFENFDEGSKGGFDGASIALSTGNWFFEDALLGNLGTSTTQDKCNGVQCVRMDRRSDTKANIYMQFDKTGGADELSFVLANYGNSSGNKLQVQYSVDQGSTWKNIGGEITATGVLEMITIPVNIEGNIRFKFVHSAGSERLNLDDVRITDFVTAETDPTISVSFDDTAVESGSSVFVGLTAKDNAVTKNIEIQNLGNPNLVISSADITGEGFTISDLQDSTLAFKEKTELTITFNPTVAGDFAGTLTLNSNASNVSTYNLTLQGEAFIEGELLPIANARKVELGTRVKIGGIVTVANELDGPAYIQDGTAGIAVFWTPFHESVQIGDSVSVFGPMTTSSPNSSDDPAEFSLQIGETATDDNITFEVIQVSNKQLNPSIITIQELLTDTYQGQLVLIQNADIDASGPFQVQNYNLSDVSGNAEIRIDNSTNIIGSQSPDNAVNVVGVVSKSSGIIQLVPRFLDDIAVENIFFPGDDVFKEQTLDIVTWNIEWFGDTGKGPGDEDLQLQNVIKVIETIDAEIYAIQEIASPSRFAELVDNLEGYGGFLSDFSQSQETAFLFKRANIDSLSGVTLSSNDGFTRTNWANGRYPLMFRFLADVNGEEQEFYTYNIHAKAFGDEDSYNQRLNASAELKNYLDNNRPLDNVIVLGDYNDEILASTFTGSSSPYNNFDEDAEYTILTKNLERRGFVSLSSSSFKSFLDHITISSELSDEYFKGTERVENTTYVQDYLSTTSDHYPVLARFKFGLLTSNEDEDLQNPTKVTLDQNYPNPFNPSTTITYTLDTVSDVSLVVYDITGRKVVTLVDGRQSSGIQSINFDASSLASGVYIYRLQTATGVSLTKKMVLIK